MAIKIRVPVPQVSEMRYGTLGDDHLTGTSGADYFFMDLGNDIINGDAGADSVFFYGLDAVTIDLSLSGAQNTGRGMDSLTSIENAIAGDGNDTVTGNAGANYLYGGGGDDTVMGGAGNDFVSGSEGTDVLFGGAGKDGFMFYTPLDKATNVDRVMDFRVKDDSIYLDKFIFKATAKLTKNGLIQEKSFKIGTKATDKDDRIIYNKKTGVLSYDADGSGSKAAVEFAKLDKKLALTSKDFFIV